MPDTSGDDAETVIDAEVVPPAPDPALPPAAPEPAYPHVPAEDIGYTVGGIPTFESVREKIETRFGTALGAAELDAETPEGRSADKQYEARQRAAADRLAQIRKQMKSGDGNH